MYLGPARRMMRQRLGNSLAGAPAPPLVIASAAVDQDGGQQAINVGQDAAAQQQADIQTLHKQQVEQMLQQQAAPAAESGITLQLHQLAQMYVTGVLSIDEFTAAKQIVLAGW